MPYQLELTQIHDAGSDVASPDRPWSATSFFDKLVFAHPAVTPVYWPGYGTCRPVPGLPTTARYAGVETVNNQLLLWSGNRILCSDIGDFSCWLPIQQTVARGRFRVQEDFVQPAAGESTDWVFLDAAPAGLVKGQYIRIDQAPVYDFFTVADIAPTAGLEGQLCAFTQSVPAHTTTTLFLTRGLAWKPGTLVWSGPDDIGLSAKVEEVSRDGYNPIYSNDDFTVPGTGAAATMLLFSPPSASPGDYVSLGTDTTDNGQDIYLVLNVSPATNSMVLRRLGIGKSVAAPGAVYASNTVVVFQPWVKATNLTATDMPAPGLSALRERFAVKLTPLGRTGATAAGGTISSGCEVSAMPANSASEIITVGGHDANGEIFSVIRMPSGGALVAKERSLWTLQPTSREQGGFALACAVADEGLFGRNSWCRVGNETIVFLGHRELYDYRGGPSGRPVGEAYTKQLFAEIDRTQPDLVKLLHYERDKEVWVIYPVRGQSSARRVLIYNYVDQTVSLDDYSPEFGGLTAAAQIDWEDVAGWDRDPESYGSVTIASAVASGGTVTVVTGSPHGLSVGDHVLVAGIAPSGFDGAFAVTATASGTSFAYANVTSAVTSVVGATASRQAIAWDQDTLNWNSEENDTGRFPMLVLAAGPDGAPTLSAHGLPGVFDRRGAAFTATWETIDFDGGDSAVFKYLDTVQLSLQVRSHLAESARLFVQAGARDNLDSDIRWGTPAAVRVDGNAARTTKVNVRRSGRYLRLRFYSQDVGVEWRISSFRLIARAGATT